jgi:hypothetical protein
VLRAALAQLPGHAQGRRAGKNVSVRIDGAGGTHELLPWLTRRRLSYSVGFSLPGDLASIQKKLASIPDAAWTPGYDADRQLRPGAFVAEVTGLFDLTSWPTGMRLIVRKERPHPGAQLDHRRRGHADHRLLPPSPPEGSWPTSSCGTAAGPAPRTASAPPRTPA